MKIRFIINPISGTGKQKNIVEIVEKYFKFENYDFVYTNKKGHASELCKSAIKDNVNIIVAVGGDGTVNECAKEIINKNIALAVLPCGSGNGFAYNIGMKKKVIDAVKQLNIGEIKKIDTATLNLIPFVNISGVGFDAHIAHLFSKTKIRGFGSYIKLVLKKVLAYNSNYYILKTNVKDFRFQAYFIAFANSVQYGNDIKISPQSNLNDGKTDIVIIKNFPKWKIPYFIYQLYIGKIHKNKYVKIIREKRIEIIHDSNPIHIDGEPYSLDNTIKIETIPNSLKIFC
tara:strand:- start:1405 stop:2262 length:858 start_codon:yes stop_codon:yes gene_type:complete